MEDADVDQLMRLVLRLYGAAFSFGVAEAKGNVARGTAKRDQCAKIMQDIRSAAHGLSRTIAAQPEREDR